MSDIDPTQKNLKPTPESLQELYESPAGIPPVEKQDHHILVQRLNESIQTETAFVPEQHREDKLTATEPARSRKGLIAGGVAAVVGLGVAAALMLGGGDKEEKVAANPTPTTEEESTPTTEEDTTATTERTESTTTIVEHEPTTVTYEYISADEAAILGQLSEYNYPDHLELSYDASASDHTENLIAVTRDLSSIINTRNYDDYIRMFAPIAVEDASIDTVNIQADFDSLDYFYAPDVSNVVLRECVDTASEVTCSGYIPTFVFDRTLSADRAQELIDNPAYPNQPISGIEVYLDMTFKIDKETNLLNYSSYALVSDEPL